MRKCVVTGKNQLGISSKYCIVNSKSKIQSFIMEKLSIDVITTTTKLSLITSIMLYNHIYCALSSCIIPIADKIQKGFLQARETIPAQVFVHIYIYTSYFIKGL